MVFPIVAIVYCFLQYRCIDLLCKYVICCLCVYVTSFCNWAAALHNDLSLFSSPFIVTATMFL